MTLKQLDAFYWAARCANFAIAADRLHLSISSLSKRIVELEVSLGCVLFDRSGYRAVLTDEGQRLLPHAIALLESAVEIRNILGANEGLSGVCTFGVGELSALTWLPSFIAAARSLYPQLLLTPHVDVGAVLEGRVNKGEMDFAVIAGRSSRQTILSLPIAQAQFVWMASPTLLNTVGTVANALRQGVPLIALPPGAGTSRIIDDGLMADGITSVTRINCNSWGAIAGMLVASVGVGILPTHWAERLSLRHQLHCLPCSEPLAVLHYSFQWRRDDPRPLIEKMRTLVCDVADFSFDSPLP
ncbi:LysR family transcriptional regulator [Budvicia aquatica]|uniref:HTH-type transcriptional regulator gltR n=1 Tax=Budvicia aquatica TaxID=82979 RepID=A0A2C6DST9_9GAMM|nr:LysR family transcriptional regulator [Budvicia aquatica]PHI31545.1 LysR family transcriptional regulator [Budvicia aquatica]VFS52022.1 HTH-type transcriptional regulator gltR [Budvicia aquatica]